MIEQTDKPIPIRPIFMGGLVAVAVSLILAFIYNPSGLVEKILLAFIAETGFACIIAVLIILLVDRREKEEFRNYITRSDRRLAARNILAYASDLDVPDVLSREIEGYLNATPFIKNFQNYIIQLKRDGDAGVVVLFNSVTEYQNISLVAQKLVQEGYLTVEKQINSSSNGHFTSFKAERFDQATKSYVSICDSTLVDSLTNAVTYSDYFSEEIKPGDRVRVTLTAQKKHPLNGSDFVRQRYLCCKMKFDLMFDQAEFDLETLLFCPGEDSASITKTAIGKSIDINRPFLVNNGLMFSWKAK